MSERTTPNRHCHEARTGNLQNHHTNQHCKKNITRSDYESKVINIMVHTRSASNSRKVNEQLQKNKKQIPLVRRFACPQTCPCVTTSTPTLPVFSFLFGRPLPWWCQTLAVCCPTKGLGGQGGGGGMDSICSRGGRKRYEIQ